MTGDKRLDVHVLTGFLGSGKTTVLRHLLADPQLTETAVLVNEFGEVGLDHLLVGAITGDAVLLGGGCICCTMRGDVATALRDLWARRARGDFPPFRRVIIETTGLADPTPVMTAVAVDLALRHHFRPGRVITTIDAVNGAATLTRFEESVRQAKLADALLLTKCDIAPLDAIASARASLQDLNPVATVHEITAGGANPTLLLHAESVGEDIDRAACWMMSNDTTPRHGGISACVIKRASPVDWADFALWFSLLAHRHGTRILRMKGILRLKDMEAPVLVQAAQHLVHQPEHLPMLDIDGPAVSLVLIVEGLDTERLQASFDTLAARA